MYMIVKSASLQVLQALFKKLGTDVQFLQSVNVKWGNNSEQAKYITTMY
jgi:hypothetical protein